jgi:hypothetical protein
MNKILAIVLFIASFSSHANQDACNNLGGVWKQTYGSIKLDTELMKPDFPQSWDMRDPKTLTHRLMSITQDIPYSCEGDIITVDAAIKGQLRIVRQEGNKMVWESLDWGGFIYVENDL